MKNLSRIYSEFATEIQFEDLPLSMDEFYKKFETNTTRVIPL